MATVLGGSKEQPNHAGISFDTTTKKGLIGRGEPNQKKRSPSYKPTPTQCHVIIINSLSQKIKLYKYKTTKKKRWKKKILVQNGLRQTG